MLIWKKSKKGTATIYTADGVKSAIVDRNGFGISAAHGKNVTYDGKAYGSVEDAKIAATIDTSNVIK